MGVFLYNVFLVLFKAGVNIAALFNKKAEKWVKGRKDIFLKLEETIPKDEKIIWMHCASLGEFEQGRPLLEKLKATYKGHKFLLTFFSPSGYEVRKDYKGADWVFYLPMDGARSAKRFLEIVHPCLVIFVKYEFWYYYLKKIKYRNIPLLLVSALFWKNMPFFKWYGSLQRKMLSRFDHLFVQNKESKALIDGIGLAGICSISGDTRFDRVIEIAAGAGRIPLIEDFIDNSKTIIAGSTWPEDEAALQSLINESGDPGLKMIIAPHEINDKHLAEIRQRFPGSLLYSQLPAGLAANSRILVIDNIGMLSRLYQYAFITYIGGGFGKGIHNTLEAAVYGKPVLFGRVYHKFKEAKDLIANGGAVSIANAGELKAVLANLLTDENGYKERCRQSFEYVHDNRGATEKIMEFIYVKRLLTN